MGDTINSETIIAKPGDLRGNTQSAMINSIDYQEFMRLLLEYFVQRRRALLTELKELERDIEALK